MYLEVTLFQSEIKRMININSVDWFEETKCNEHPVDFRYVNTVLTSVGGIVDRLDKESSSRFLKLFKSQIVAGFVQLDNSIFLHRVDDNPEEE